MTKYLKCIILLFFFGCNFEDQQNVTSDSMDFPKDSLNHEDNGLKIESAKENSIKNTIDDSVINEIEDLEILYKKLEVIDFDDITINRTLMVKNNLEDVIKNLGEPDSIQESGFESISNWFGETKTAKYYYKNSYFETHGQSANLDKIYFGDNQFTMEFKDVVFDNKTTIDLFKRRFPNAYKYSLIENQRNEIYENFKIRILFTRSSSGAWIFEFLNDKLDNVYIWHDNT
ncbi:MAG: hypothetical protein ACKVTZ_13685 [Bacteroidia bacterium]